MSKIGVALALAVILVGAVLFIGDGIAETVVNRGGDIGNSLSSTNLRVNSNSGSVTITTP